MRQLKVVPLEVVRELAALSEPTPASTESVEDLREYVKTLEGKLNAIHKRLIREHGEMLKVGEADREAMAYSISQLLDSMSRNEAIEYMRRNFNPTALAQIRTNDAKSYVKLITVIQEYCKNNNIVYLYEEWAGD